MRYWPMLVLPATVLALFTVIFILGGCSKEQYNACKTELDKCVLVKSDWSLEQLDLSCKKLADCMKMDHEILNFANQPKNPYACSIWKVEDGYRRAHYYYPKGELSFGEVYFDRLEDSITTCEMMTKTGDKSKAYHDALEETFKEMDRRKAAQKKADEELAKPKPTVTVRVVK